MSLQIYKSAELAICTTRVEGRRVGPRVLLHALRHSRHYTLRVKIILVDFNLAVATQTAKFNSPSNFPAIRYSMYKGYSRGFHNV